MIEIRPIAASIPDVLSVASDNAPYLKRLISRDWSRIECGAFEALERAHGPWLDGWRATLADLASIEDAMEPLRRFKREGHLLIALQDLAGLARLHDVTERLAEMADLAVETALRVSAAKRGLSLHGLSLIALGKHGARELNYSSDTDMVAVYDRDVFDGGSRDPGDAASRILRDAITLLETQTGDGYVFRTDFRLRPDPSSTPLAVSTDMAAAYYESVGQNWERMVYIKARPCAGDKAIAQQFLDALAPFVWRRHLDYWAIADIHAIKRMINTKVGAPDLGDVGSDLKLGPGGIREIEFFAQTQQIILGGRDPSLREPTTCGALSMLADAGVIDVQACQELTGAYEQLRSVEHRIQMLDDQQTHAIPQDDGARARVATLCGYRAREDFETALIAVRKAVHAHYQNLFSEEERKARHAVSGNLVFTGVDIDPATVRTLSVLGFSDPEHVIRTVQLWHRGRVPAARTSRGRQLLTAVLPDLLAGMGDTGEADAAFAQFATFFAGLSSGVQFLSMLLAEETLRDELVSTLALAPRLARTLAREPECLEAMIDGGERDRLLVSPDADFETAMDEARRYNREATLLIGHRLLHGRLDASDAGKAWTSLADETLVAMAQAAERETSRRFGPPPGRWHVFSMGKMGGRELTAGSDLDLIVLFDPHASTDGAQTWFTRFTQRFITAISAPTGEGQLYEIDMRLRPSGGAGPVAVSLNAFKRYQVEDAWTWEHMALTRLRPVAGDAELAAAAVSSAHAAIVGRAQSETIRRDIAEMRERIARDKPASGVWDFKLARGGLVDIEFLAQLHLLRSGDASLITGNTNAALSNLESAGAMSHEIARPLRESLRFQQSLQQVVRVAIGEAGPRQMFPKGLQGRMARAVGATDFETVKTQLAKHRDLTADIFRQNLHLAATE